MNFTFQLAFRVALGISFGVSLATLFPIQSLGQVLPGRLWFDHIPVYNPNSNPSGGTGFDYGGISLINANGTTVGTFNHYISGSSLGQRAVRWDYGFGFLSHELLEPTGNPISGNLRYTYATAINNAGQVSGHILEGDTAGTNIIRSQGVRWNSGTLTPELLDFLSTGIEWSVTYGMNQNGTVVGSGEIGSSVNNSLGQRAVRWDGGGTVATELAHLGTNLAGWTSAAAYAVNNHNTTVGSARIWDSSGNDAGSRAVRWDAGSTAANQLALPVTGSIEVLACEALGINDNGTIFGNVTERYTSPSDSAHRAVRWDSAGNVTLLESPGAQGHDAFSWFSVANDINQSGVVVGESEHWDASGNFVGMQAVRWDAGTATPTILASLSTLPDGSVSSGALTINDAGTIGGYSVAYDDHLAGYAAHAAVWLPGGQVVDLNQYNVQPVSGSTGTWVLTSVTSIVEDGWATGQAVYDADGPGTDSGFTNTVWNAQLGFGGVIVSSPGAALRRWRDGRNWSTGTPALEIGRAFFSSPGERRMYMDDYIQTLSVDVEQGDVYLNVGGTSFTVDERIRILAGARLSMHTDYDPLNEILGVVFGNIENEGTFSPGNSPGFLNLAGDLTNTGSLEFEIAGTALDEYDRLWVGGLFDANGTLKVILDGYTPVAGDAFVLLSWNSLVNNGMVFDFSSANLTTGLRWDTSDFWTNGSVAVVTVPEPVGVGALIAIFVGAASCCRRRMKQ